MFNKIALPIYLWFSISNPLYAGDGLYDRVFDQSRGEVYLTPFRPANTSEMGALKRVEVLAAQYEKLAFESGENLIGEPGRRILSEIFRQSSKLKSESYWPFLKAISQLAKDTQDPVKWMDNYYFAGAGPNPSPLTDFESLASSLPGSEKRTVAFGLLESLVTAWEEVHTSLRSPKGAKGSLIVDALRKSAYTYEWTDDWQPALDEIWHETDHRDGSSRSDSGEWNAAENILADLKFGPGFEYLNWQSSLKTKIRIHIDRMTKKFPGLSSHALAWNRFRKDQKIASIGVNEQLKALLNAIQIPSLAEEGPLLPATVLRELPKDSVAVDVECLQDAVTNLLDIFELADKSDTKKFLLVKENVLELLADENLSKLDGIDVLLIFAAFRDGYYNFDSRSPSSKRLHALKVIASHLESSNRRRSPMISVLPPMQDFYTPVDRSVVHFLNYRSAKNKTNLQRFVAGVLDRLSQVSDIPTYQRNCPELVGGVVN
jgi:hypothetical protein